MVRPLMTTLHPQSARDRTIKICQIKCHFLFTVYINCTYKACGNIYYMTVHGNAKNTLPTTSKRQSNSTAKS